MAIISKIISNIQHLISKIIKIKKLDPKGILIIVLIIIIIGLLVYFTLPEKEVEKLPEEVVPEIPTPEQAGAGPVGEVKVKDITTGEEKPVMTPEIPSNIYNTTGEIAQVKSDHLIVQGSGSNFADQKPRTLTVFVTAKTVISGQGIPLNLTGKEGLKYLKAGDSILVEGDGNIRGKTDFAAVRIKKR